MGKKALYLSKCTVKQQLKLQLEKRHVKSQVIPYRSTFRSCHSHVLHAKNSLISRSEVLTGMSSKMQVFHDVTTCRLAYGYQSIEGVYCLQVKGQAAHRFMDYLPCKQGHYAPPKRW